MDDQRRNDLLKQYDDLTMELLMDEAAETDGRLLWEDFTVREAVPMPEAMDAACEKLIRSTFKKEEHKRRRAKNLKHYVRAAVIALCLLNLASYAVLKVDALRIPIVNFFIDTYDKFSVIAFDGITHQPAPQSLYDAMESAVPEGYSFLQESFPSANFGSILFESETGELLSLNVYPSDMETSYDTENSSISEMTICDTPTIVIEKVTPNHNYITIIWLDKEDTTAYSLYGSGLPLKDMTHIAAPLIEFTAK